ncbi:PASTA domain-containing protein [Streptomyces sp. SID3343]|uniref:PASTA domain-containing protein n=1 Tax=Streptomyces sp. SID3343 TaxID=2690260 RepID=UPI00136C3086|nr:PASTA domain-containing protein [Streptomyces sp. SID3343]MYV99045.1 PASTA domain-containing protein [Streptomyces sp. SID3343]
MVHCLLCGTPYDLNDAYCPGEQCGTDLHGQRTGDPACAVQAWCEPRRLTAAPGETVMVTLTLRNAGSAPDRYDPEIPRDVGRRIGLDRTGPPDVYPGEERAWTIVYTVPVDVEDSIAPSGLFGLGGMDADGGSAYEQTSHVVEETDVAVRVVSARDMRVSARAPFSVRVVSTDRDDDRGGPARSPSGPPGPYRDREHRNGRRGARIAGAAVATVAAIVVALLVGMAMAGSDGKSRPAAESTANGTARPSTTSGATTTPTVEAPVTGTPDETASASDSTSASPSTSTSTSAPGKLTVPDVVGRTEAQGVAMLRERGFRPAVVGSGGTVVSTDPSAGRKVDRDKPDVVVVMSGSAASPGPPATTAAPPPLRQTPVPAVVGRSTSEAQSRLQAVGLGVALVEVESSTTPPDTVVRSNPGAGRLVPDGSTVTLTIARAPAPATSAPPPETTKAPGIVGLAVDRARERVRLAGLTLDVDDPQSKCTVASQSPQEGADVRVGGAVSATMATACG